ncbi:hypothetical protein [Photobacterium galatheae]|uniref:Uncharacterized protein n=1 Tax=Photobacterium galatheae TaxID=1654360 RepID=A0A066RKN4_9GAMM|nr:hypothetical protein [Photobacterium galatheae]KDM90904.1 hypothetical protein EA58_14185 [Photobacterium galatheae]MCM0149132.1 hypothetical protein [Photobacterium galatheae]
MLMKKIWIAGLVAFSSVSAFAIDVTVEEMQYIPKEQRVEKLGVQKLNFDGALVDFAGVKIHQTKGLEDALRFIEGQQQMSDLRKKALKALAYSSAFTIQNANDRVALQQYSKTASLVAGCGYFGLDEEITFITESIFTKLIEGKESYKENLILGSLQQADLTPLSMNPRYVQDAIMSCSENLKVWLPK